jgi:preprotein translocase subunit SecB
MIEIKELINHPIQLVKVEMISCNLEKNIKNFDKNALDNLAIKLRAWGQLSEDKKNVGYTYLNVKIDCEEEDKPFFLDVVYRGECILYSKIDDDSKYEKFLETQGLKLLWPYLRVAITDIMIKMDIEPVKLPTLDVLKTMGKSNRMEEE